MTATAEPSARREGANALAPATGIELLGDVHGSGYARGAALVRRADGQVVQLGPLMFALLECVDGERSVSELAACMTEKLGRGFDEEHVAAVAEKLAAQGLLAGTEENAPPRQNPLLALRWKVLVTDEAITRRLTAPFTFLFRPWVLWPVLAAFLVVCWFVLVEKGVASATHQAFDSPEWLLLIFVLAMGSAGFHELGHASACRYGGGTPGGMGCGLYIVWPAFYTDVTDAYRLPRRDRLRVDLGGLYFNAIVAVATLGTWLLWRKDALLLLIALQLLQMVKQLSPVIRADGYHILADATGVPDLYAHIGPTLKRLLPWRRREPSALHGKARALVTLWVLVVVPILAALALGAVLIFPRIVATAWHSGSDIVSGIPHQSVVGVLISLVRLLALLLPVLGTALVVKQLAQKATLKAAAWSEGHPARRSALVFATATAVCGAAWAWWPSGQYRPIHASDQGTLVAFRHVLASPTAVARPRPTPVDIAPGTRLALALIPVGGATKEHPALFVVPGKGGERGFAIISSTAADGPTDDPTGTVEATAFPFELPEADPQQPASTQTQRGGVTYNIVYSLVTIRDGAPVDSVNKAYAIASCNGCTTVAVSFQVVLVVGQSNRIAPINAALAYNRNCPSCITTAIADQIVVTLRDEPTDELVARIQAALKKLDAISALGENGTPAAIASAVLAVQKEIDQAIEDSGLAPPKPAATTTSANTTTTATTTATAPATTTAAVTTTTQATTTAPTTTTTETTPTTTTSETTPTTTTTSTTETTTTTETTP